MTTRFTWNSNPLEQIVYQAFFSAIAILFLASIVQTKVYLDGHAQHLVSPAFLVGAIGLFFIARSAKLSIETKAKLLALSLGGISIAIAPASPTALTVGTMISVMATAVWLFTQPTLLAVGFWILTASGAIVSHLVFSETPEVHPAKSVMVVLIGGGICLLMHSYAKNLRRQTELLEKALLTSKQGVVRRFNANPELLHLDPLAQAILRHDEPTMGLYEFRQRIRSCSNNAALLSLETMPKNDGGGIEDVTLVLADERHIKIDIFAARDQQVWLILDVTENRARQLENERLIEAQRGLLGHIRSQQQVNDLAIQAADIVVYEIDCESGYASVVAGRSSWPQAWATKPFLNVLGDVLPVEDREALQRAMKNPGQIAEFLIRDPRTAEPAYWGQLGFTAPLEREGRTIQMGYRQITDGLVKARKAAEEARKHSQAMLDRLNNTAEGGSVGLFRHDLKNDTWECNEIFRAFYELPETLYPELTTDLIDARLEPNTREAQQQDRLLARSSPNQQTQERVLVLPDGKRRILKVVAKPEYRGNELVAMVGSAFDVTTERETQQALSQANTRLSELLERQRSMFAIIGHELRTPVASIEMLAQDQDLSSREKIELVQDISQGLLGVLEDLRTVISPERVREAQMVIDNPSTIIQRSITPLYGLLHQREIELHFDLPTENMQSRLNAQALRQLVTNLVKNAAIHSGASNIWVSLNPTERSGAKIRAELRVEDDGKGLDPAQAAQLFEAYARGDTDAEGSGLGLFISSELAIALGGQIHYETSHYGGAAFVASVELEVSQNGTKLVSQSEGRSAPISISGKRVLFAEDERTLQMLTAKILTKAGAQVQVCSNGAEALGAYKADSFDLVITDIMMPKVNGYGLTKGLRASGYQGLIIGATAAVIGDETDSLLSAGADTVISKPISLEKLEAALGQLAQETG